MRVRVGGGRVGVGACGCVDVSLCVCVWVCGRGLAGGGVRDGERPMRARPSLRWSAALLLLAVEGRHLPGWG